MAPTMKGNVGPTFSAGLFTIRNHEGSEAMLPRFYSATESTALSTDGASRRGKQGISERWGTLLCQRTLRLPVRFDQSVTRRESVEIVTVLRPYRQVSYPNEGYRAIPAGVP